uniref:ATP synthase F0 subunit 8 n=1 Tax=Falconius longicornis TaxID=2793211 RepID=A0A7T0NC25_9ORTH|nr:ATP synthase F0 subunit 8 [Falconius longicornis]
MPQMSNLWWLTLMIYFSIIFITTMTMMFPYSSTPSIKLKKSIKTTKPKMWLW